MQTDPISAYYDLYVQYKTRLYYTKHLHLWNVCIFRKFGMCALGEMFKLAV